MCGKELRKQLERQPGAPMVPLEMGVGSGVVKLLGKLLRTAPKVRPLERAATNRALFERYKDVLRSEMARPQVTDPDLAKAMSRLYRPGAKEGSGSTAAAVRIERLTGKAVGNRFHSQKARDEIAHLEKWLKNKPNASRADRKAAEDVIRDMQNALDGH
jgi:hypothetical protein